MRTPKIVSMVRNWLRRSSSHGIDMQALREVESHFSVSGGSSSWEILHDIAGGKPLLNAREFPLFSGPLQRIDPPPYPDELVTPLRKATQTPRQHRPIGARLSHSRLKWLITTLVAARCRRQWDRHRG